MKPRRLAPLTLPLLLTLCPPLSADEVTGQLDSAHQAYAAGELHNAVERLKVAIAKIQEQMNARLLTLLPEPLDGWQADPGEIQSGGIATMLTGTSLSRRYRREDGAEVKLSLTADSPLLPMITMALSMPMIMQANPALQPYTFKDQRGTIEHEDGTKDYEITLLAGNRLLIQLEGSGLTDRQPLEGYLERLDLERIQQAITN